MRFTLLLLPLCACFERQYDCDNSALVSVSVQLRSSDALVIEEPWVRYTAEGAEEPTACDLTHSTWLCGWEVAGQILIEAGGLCYGSVSQTVTVEQGECHVINQDLELLLDPVDCTAEEIPAVYVTVMGEGSVTIEEPTVGYVPADQDWTDYEPCEAYDQGWACGWGWTGLIDLEVDADGWQPWTGQVDVAEDCCGPVTEQVDVVLPEDPP
jgi:hypothetical protein